MRGPWDCTGHAPVEHLCGASHTFIFTLVVFMLPSFSVSAPTPASLVPLADLPPCWPPASTPSLLQPPGPSLSLVPTHSPRTLLPDSWLLRLCPSTPCIWPFSYPPSPPIQFLWKMYSSFNHQLFSFLFFNFYFLILEITELLLNSLTYTFFFF